MKPAAYFRRARALVCESAARHGRSSAELQRSQISALLMQLGMLPQQLLAGAGTGRLARRALHDPLGRLEKNRAYGDAGPATIRVRTSRSIAAEFCSSSSRS